MKRAAIIAIGLALSTPAFAADAEVKPAAKVMVTDASVPASDAKAVAPIKMPTEVPKDASGAIDLAKDTFNAGKAKNWWLMSAGIIWLLMFVMKIAGLFKKIGKRWAYISVGVLSMAAMLLAKFGGGASWEAAVALMTSGPFMAFANDFIKRGILGKEPTTPIKS